MSKIFDALNSKQSTVATRIKASRVSLQKPPPPETANSRKDRYYPKFTEYKIDQILDYLLSLHALGTGSTYGIVPVSRSIASADIVLETFMHLCANCAGRKLLTDLSTSKLMLQQLLTSHAFDQPHAPDQVGKVSSVLHSLFYFLSTAEESTTSKRCDSAQNPELAKLTESYDFSLFLFPEVSKFNISNVQLARQVDNMILLCPEKGDQDLAKTGKFIEKLGVQLKGVYLFE